MKQYGTPCMLIRGGTSKGAYFLASDLPVDQNQRDRFLLAVMGSPDPRQIDGLGGAHPLTSKVAIVSPSNLPAATLIFSLRRWVSRPPRSIRRRTAAISSPGSGHSLSFVDWCRRVTLSRGYGCAPSIPAPLLIWLYQHRAARWTRKASPALMVFPAHPRPSPLIFWKRRARSVVLFCPRAVPWISWRAFRSPSSTMACR